MSVTIYGFVFVVLSIFAFLRSYQAVAYLYAFSYLFQVSAVVIIGNIGFMPYLFTPLLLIVKGFRLKYQCDSEIKNIQLFSVCFLVFVVVQAITAFLLFNGDVMVFDGGGMESAINQGKIPFSFSGKQIVQWVYLALNMGGLISLLKHRHYLKPDFSKKVVVYSVLFVIIIGLWKYTANNFLGWFPEDFFFNNSSYKLQNIQQLSYGKFRFNSIFFEASICGLFLALFWWNLFYIEKFKRKFLLVLVAASLLLSLASTGFFCMFLAAVIFLIAERNIKAAIALIICSSIVVFLIYGLNLGDAFIDLTVNKSDSESAQVRSIIMYSGIEMLRDTYGFGCGLGTSTAAGLATTLLGQIGIVGTILFCVWLIPVFRFVKKNGERKMQQGVLLVLGGMCVSVGYLSFPILWLELIIAVATKREMYENV